jgi:hypothetical protein
MMDASSHSAVAGGNRRVAPVDGVMAEVGGMKEPNLQQKQIVCFCRLKH